MTPASLDELLKEWEASAKVRYSQYKDTDAVLIPVGNLRGEQERILSLIAVVRKQSVALSELMGTPNMACTEDYQQDLYRMQRAKVHIAEAERILNETK